MWNILDQCFLEVIVVPETKHRQEVNFLVFKVVLRVENVHYYHVYCCVACAVDEIEDVVDSAQHEAWVHVLRSHLALQAVIDVALECQHDYLRDQEDDHKCRVHTEHSLVRRHVPMGLDLTVDVAKDEQPDQEEGGLQNDIRH
jgi:hypothetical protein